MTDELIESEAKAFLNAKIPGQTFEQWLRTRGRLPPDSVDCRETSRRAAEKLGERQIVKKQVKPVVLLTEAA